MSVTREQILALLRELEWAAGYANGVGGYVDICPFCRQTQKQKHVYDCALAQMIADLTAEKAKETP